MVFPSRYGKEAFIKPHIKVKESSAGGILERKFEKLLVLGTISTGCDSVTRQAIKDGDEQVTMECCRAATLWVDLALTRVVQICAERLTSQEEWRNLAGNREHFTETLDRTVKAASTALKLLYRFSDHRPSEHEKRDQELYRIKEENTGWSFGHLRLHYNHLHPEDQLSDQQAERSYKQEFERVRRQMTRAHDAAKIYLEASASPLQERLNKLPTPEDVLDILTTK